MDTGSAAPLTGAEWIGRAPHQPLDAADRPLLASDDPFYEPPPGFEHARPGTVLRSRDVALAFLGLVPQPFRATQLLYRTTDMRGEPDVAVTTVIMPMERRAGAKAPVVSYQCAIDAVTGRCFPSYALRRRARAIGSLAQLEFLLMAALLAEGWVVSIPDHEGPQGIWGTPFEPGYRILDGLRAAQRYEPAGISPDAPIGLWGYSGGGLATAWAAEVLADYAPELKVAGAVLGSPVGNLGNTFHRLNGSIFAALPALVVAGLAQVYPEIQRVLIDHATDEGVAKLARLQKMCTAQAVVWYMGKDMDDYVDQPLQAILDTPDARKVFEDIRLGRTAPSIPLLVVQAVNDRIVSVDDVDALIDTYAAGGTDVSYHRDLFSEHILLHSLSAPMTLRWLNDRFAGKPLSHKKLRTKWPTMFNPSTYRGMVRLGLISAKVATGRRVGHRPLSVFDR